MEGNGQCNNQRMISEVDISHHHCHGLSQSLRCHMHFDMGIDHLLCSAISCVQSENERCKHIIVERTGISGNIFKTTTPVMEEKLRPFCKISKNPMNETMGNVHFESFLSTNVWSYGVNGGRET